MKIFKKENNNWVLVSELKKLAQKYNIEISFEKDEDFNQEELENHELSFELNIYPNYNVYSTNETFLEDDYISYSIIFNSLLNKNYKVLFKHFYQIELDKNLIPKEIISIKQFEVLFFEIKKSYSKKYLNIDIQKNSNNKKQKLRN